MLPDSNTDTVGVDTAKLVLTQVLIQTGFYHRKKYK